MSRLLMAAALAACVVAAPAWAQMPDARSMSGMSMPTTDLPDGTVSVRVVRGGMTNNLSGVAVELHGAGATREATTGADGRAQFSGVPAGSQVHALAVVDGERLESQPFEVPAKGGVRTLLVASEAGVAQGGTAASPPAPSSPASSAQGSASREPLSLGGNSRIALEFNDDALSVFYLFEIVNRSGAAISPPAALVFDMPAAASGTTVLEGSTKQASAKGPQVTVTGPFPPGVTPLQMAFRVDTFGSELALEQKFPLPMDMVAIAVQRLEGMTISSPQVARIQDTPIEGMTFAMGNGPALAAGSPLTLQLAGLPYHSRMPVYVALVLVVAMVVAAAWYSYGPGGADASGARARVLEARRDKGLAALATLERQHRAGQVDEAQYASRRAALMAQLERIYGELDKSGGQGAAA